MILTLNKAENQNLGRAAFLYDLFTASADEKATIKGIAAKFVAVIDTLPEGELPADQTISVDLTEDEAAVLVRVIDTVTGRDESLEGVREQLGGRETTQPDPAEPFGEDGDEIAAAGDLLGLLFGGAA